MAALARMDLSVMILLLVGGIALIGGGFYAMTFLKGGKRANRIKSVLSKHRSEMSKRQMESLAKPSAIRSRKEKVHVELLQTMLERLQLRNLLFSTELRSQLAQAGMRGRSAVVVYVSSRILLSLFLFLGVLIFLQFAKDFPYPDFVKFIFAGVAGAVGFYLPRVLLSNTVQKRQQQMIKAFPDTMDLLVICVEAGLGIENAFARVTEELMESAPVLAQELGITSAELAYLGDRRQAYENFSNRTGLPAVKSLATALIQSEQYGTPVGVALKVLAQEKRDERMAAAEKKAAALPAKLTVPMIIFFLPVLFLVVIGPAALQVTGL